MSGDSKSVTRREFKAFAKAQKKLNKAHRKAEQRLEKAQARAIRIALKINAVEIKRRLKILNGEQKRIDASQSKSVSKELYDADRRSDMSRISALEKAENERSGGTRMVFALASSGAISGIIGLIWLLVSTLRGPLPTALLPVYQPAPPGALLPSAPAVQPSNR